MAAPTTLIEVTGKVDVPAKVDVVATTTKTATVKATTTATNTTTANTSATLDGVVNVNLIPPTPTPDPDAVLRDARRHALSIAMELRPRTSVEPEGIIHCAAKIAAYIMDGTTGDTP